MRAPRTAAALTLGLAAITACSGEIGGGSGSETGDGSESVPDARDDGASVGLTAASFTGTRSGSGRRARRA